ncbi:nidogen-like domain-containing protein [Aliivibrio kagoshimensis]|uniref:nidogen-like domain-containing protein n=1 Tax=Aliivibrio kagoshimensis TaxID=2910230 RepID=UPI003D0ADE2F
MNKFSTALLSTLLISQFTINAQASVMLKGFGGPTGYGELAMTKNDDDSSNELDLPFEVNFFGNSYETFFVNNNGNLTFNGAENEFVPQPFPVANNPMIAPFWADIDTRCNDCGDVYVGSSEGIMTATWENVGYFPVQSNVTNSFQVVLIDRSADTGNSGDFDVEFRYEKLDWVKEINGDGGDDGLEPQDELSPQIAAPTSLPQSTPEPEASPARAQAGYDAGDGVNFYALPGSNTTDIAKLTSSSNTGEDGVWRFAIRDGALPGETPDNPIMPVVSPEGWEFDFNVDLNQRVFIDPDVATGYDYYVDQGDNFATVLLPSGYDDDNYELWLLNGNGNWVLSATIAAGDIYTFASGGVSEFRILGIDVDNMLDPTNPLGFVTGLTFTGAGNQQIRQVAITEFVEPVGVSEPQTALLFLMALGGLVVTSSRKKQRV